MNIGVISNFYPPQERGGAELVASRVADELTSRGHKLFVLTTMPFAGLDSLRPRVTESHLQKIYRFYPLNLYHVSHASAQPFPLKLLWHLIDLHGPFPHRAVAKVFHQERPDVILTHNLKGLGVSVARQIQKAGIHHIHTIHDVQLSVPSGVLLSGDENHWMNTGRVRQQYESQAKYAIGIPDVVISPSQYLADFYRARGFFKQSEIHILPNPAPKEREPLVRATHSPSGPLRFFFVGQLETHKGIRLLLDAVSKLDCPYELHIAGEGACAQEIIARANSDKRIHMHGFISLDHIRQLMCACDAVVLPSLCYENSPTVLYESFQIGTPVIASRIGGITERIVEGENGMLVEPNNVEALAHALKTFAHDRESFWSHSTAIKKNASAFAIEKYVDQLERLLRACS